MKVAKDLDGYNYLVLQGNNNDGVEIDACNSENEVFEIITDRILEEIDFFVTDAWSSFDELKEDEPDLAAYIEGVLDYIDEYGYITDIDYIVEIYKRMFADGWWFSVIELESGTEWFSKEGH